MSIEQVYCLPEYSFNCVQTRRPSPLEAGGTLKDGVSLVEL